MLGSGPSSPLTQANLPELLAYAHDTQVQRSLRTGDTECHYFAQHEKIIRALALALAFMMYGHEEAADPVIEQLSRDRDPIIRYGKHSARMRCDEMFGSS
jgi:26S proteasome regulatory subunit N2